jgi:long-chain acyl-CoA synthetase
MTFFEVGAHNVLIPSPRPISNLKKAFEKFPFTWLTGVNTLYHALTKEVWFQNNPPRHLKMSIAGGMQLFPATAEAWLKITQSPLLEGYGLSEASPVVSFNPLGGKVKSDSIGVPLPSTDIRLVDDDENDVPLNTPGEILVRGPQVMKGYWRTQEETKKVLTPDGWLATGDIAVMDDEGYLKIVDRKKDMILVSGFNVYPNEVEACLLQLDGILECAVVGHPDEITGEMVQAYIVCLPTANLHEDHVKEHCKKFLTGYKIPRNVIFVKDIPKSAVGKILRRELRVKTPS